MFRTYKDVIDDDPFCLPIPVSTWNHFTFFVTKNVDKSLGEEKRKEKEGRKQVRKRNTRQEGGVHRNFHLPRGVKESTMF
jgi:hypothetical protein